MWDRGTSPFLPPIFPPRKGAYPPHAPSLPRAQSRTSVAGPLWPPVVVRSDPERTTHGYLDPQAEIRSRRLPRRTGLGQVAQAAHMAPPDAPPRGRGCRRRQRDRNRQLRKLTAGPSGPAQPRERCRCDGAAPRAPFRPMRACPPPKGGASDPASASCVHQLCIRAPPEIGGRGGGQTAS